MFVRFLLDVAVVFSMLTAIMRLFSTFVKVAKSKDPGAPSWRILEMVGPAICLGLAWCLLQQYWR